jgi:hypothetical protein
MIWPRCRAIACLLSAASALLPRIAAGQAQPEQLRLREQMLARQREQYDRSIRSLLPLGQRQMSQVMNLRVDDGRLVLHTSLRPWPNFSRRRADVNGFRSAASVAYTQFLPDSAAARQFEFNLDDYPDADTFTRLHVVWRPVGELSVERTEQSSRGFARVMFVQGPKQAQLLVFSNREPLSPGGRNVNVSERDFMTLRRKHQAQTEQWLRPLFRQLKQDEAFAPDINTAWQVLADRWPVEGKVSQAVQRLLPDLGSESSHVRNRSANELARLGRDGATALLRTDRTRLTLEQTVRVDEVLSRFRRMPDADAARLRDDPDFLLDCMYCDDMMVRRLASDCLADEIGHAPQINPDADPDERAVAIQHLRAVLHPATQPATRPALNPS